jgi:hypothetical protein
MADAALADKIARARELLQDIRHIPVATVNADGSPHSSPVFMAFDQRLRGYWCSSPASTHSQNIARDGRVFLVVFDSREGHGGLFIEATAQALETADAAQPAHQALVAAKERLYGSMGKLTDYLAPAPQRLYLATPQKFWVNKSQRDSAGTIIADNRFEITLQDLLGADA